jgi:proteasome lid subunit RPN8/RPN11
MNFSIAATIRHRLAPQHELSCPLHVWLRLIMALRQRGGFVRESGAFLLGKEEDDRRRITGFALYDDIDPHALDTGIVRLDGSHFGKLWDFCSAKGLMVLADVHTHPGGSGQSSSDQANPIIARAGHIALIIPNFASWPVRRREVGIYRYLGAARWETIPAGRHTRFFHIGL